MRTTRGPRHSSEALGSVQLRRAASICIALLSLTASPLPAHGQVFGEAAAPGAAEWGATDGTPQFHVRFHLEDGGSAAIGAARPAGSGTRPRFSLFVVDEALASTTRVDDSAGGPLGVAAPGISAAAETFVLEVASPRFPALESAGRIGAGGPRYSFTPAGLTVGWPAPKPVNRENDAFKWDSYLRHNLHMLAWQHGYRIACQEKTRVGMRKPWLRQWRYDVTAIPRRWGDDDSFVTNYIGHPIMGAVMGYFEVVNHPVHARLEFGDRGYWRARGMALVASAVASTQFEIGPLSEATTGLHPSKQGMVDFVITPLVGTGMIVAEDALDRYVIARMEVGRGTLSRRILRCTLNPARTLANLFAFRAAWRRDTRPD